MSKDMVKEVGNTFKCAVAASGSVKCKHEFQDERYGKDMRIFITLGGGTNSGTNKKRCTVCNTMS